MVDQESRSYRPRRAFIEPEAEPTPPPAPDPAPRRPRSAARPPRTSTTRMHRSRCTATSTCRGRSTTPNARPTGARQPRRRWSTAERAPTANDAVNGGAAQPPAAPPRPDANDVGSDDTAIRSFTFAPRTRRTADETTTILARSGSTARGRYAPSGPSGPDDLDEGEDEDDSRPIGERARWALAIGVVAAVVVLGLAIGYAVLGLGDDNKGTVPPPAETPARWARRRRPASPSRRTNGGALLTNDLMLSAAQAKPLDPKRTWKEALTQRGASEDAPVPACFGVEPPDGQPVSQQKILRVLSSSGKSAPSALHDATAYATPEEAVAGLRRGVPTLGTCPAAGRGSLGPGGARRR